MSKPINDKKTPNIPLEEGDIQKFAHLLRAEFYFTFKKKKSTKSKP